MQWSNQIMSGGTLQTSRAHGNSAANVNSQRDAAKMMQSCTKNKAHSVRIAHLIQP